MDDCKPMGFDKRTHWERMHSQLDPYQVTWFQAKPELSLALIEQLGLREGARLIDVGAGISVLVDHLLERGGLKTTLLDLSEQALDHTRKRLGEKAVQVEFIAGDLLEVDLGGPYDLWHDRAVYHFLTEAADRDRYAERMAQSLAPGGHAIIATFAENGPEKCSGLPVVRYCPDFMGETLGETFSLLDSQLETHVTPAGGAQHFQYCLFRREPD
jgi:2-polyprenyl-3-methyl-5-hydroxy-6-metoxy-1,4-benzoquinol methylase